MKTFVALFLSLLFFASSVLAGQGLDYASDYNFSTEVTAGGYANGLGNLNWNRLEGEEGALDLNFEPNYDITTNINIDDEAIGLSLPEAVGSTGFGSGLGNISFTRSRGYLLGGRHEIKPPWQTATGKYPIFPTSATEKVYSDLSYLAKSGLLRGDLYTQSEDGGKRITPEGVDFKERFCAQVKSTATGEPREFMAMSFLPDTPGTTKRASEVHLTDGGLMADQKSLYRISAAAKDFYNKLCERKTTAECIQENDANPDRMDAVCEEVFQTHFLTPHMDLRTTYLSSIFNNHTTLASIEDQDEFMSQATCAGGKNCYFMPSSGEKSCDPFYCSMADRDSLNMDSLQWSKAFLLGSPDYRFASSDLSLCDKCFREQFSVLSDRGETPDATFEQSKAQAEKELLDRLAANAAGKALLEFSAGLETAFDLSKLYPQTFEGLSAQNFCAVDFGEKFNKLSSEGCGNGTGKEEVKKRLAMTAQSLGIEKEVFLEAGGIVRGLAQKINPSREGNSCQREDFVKSAKLQWNSIGNQEYVEAFREALNETSSNPIIGQYCRNKNLRPLSRNVADVYSETAAHDYWLEKGEEVYRMISEGGKVRDILLTEHCPITTEGDVAEKAICGKGGAAFQGLANAENSRLQMILDQKANISKEEFERLFKRSLQLRLKAALEVPMKLDPGIRLVLNDWDLYCKARYEYETKDLSLLRHLRGSNGGFELFNPDTVLQLHDFVESIAVNKSEFKDKINTFRTNLCGQAAQKVESAVCRAGNIDLEKELSRYSPEDIKKAQAQLKRERGLKDQLAMNSLSCSLKTMEREKPEAFSPTDTTLASALGVPSSFEENLAVEERKNGFGKNTATQWGMNFNTWDQCSEATKDFNDRLLGSTGGSEVEVEDSYDPGRYMSHHREITAQYNSISKKPPVIAVGGGGSLKSGEGSTVADFFGFGVDSDLKQGPNKTLERKTPLASAVEIAQEENASFSSPVNDTRELNVKNDGDRLFEQEDGSGQGWSPFPSAQAAARAPASMNPTEINPSVFAPVVDSQVSFSDEEDPGIAEKAGIKDLDNSNEKFKQAFEDVLDRKLNRRDLDRLRAENDKLIEEMERIKDELDSGSKPVKVLDESGADRTGIVSNPAASSKVVLNPRNQGVNEFRSRAYFEGRKSEYSPNYSSTYQPVKVSLEEYSSQRRAIASKAPISEVKEFNTKLDESFLQRTASTKVDDSYVERYVEHVNKNSGSIEHLVVFENGMPVKIRVPDPQNPGNYVERPLSGELAERVLKEVEGDEISSYAIYNMVSFGESLQDFMASLEKEESNLAALELLNQRLEEAKSLE